MSRRTLQVNGLDKAHEVGGNGDTPMGSERAHLKRDRTLSPKRSGIMGAVADRFLGPSKEQ